MTIKPAWGRDLPGSVRTERELHMLKVDIALREFESEKDETRRQKWVNALQNLCSSRD